MIPTARPIRCFLAGLIPLVLLSFVFGRLVSHPSFLIADGDRPSVDRALPKDAVAPGNDLTRLFLPHHARIASALKTTGRIPGWDPAGFGGRPLVGNPQAGLWYPPVWVAWYAWRPSALGWLTLAHLLWGAFGVLALARSVRLGLFAATVAAGCWIANPYILAQTFEGHYPHVWAATWFPWAFWAAIGLKRGRRRGSLLPPILALSFLTGHAQEGYYLTLTLGLWLLAEVVWRVMKRPSIGQSDLRCSALLSVMTGVAILLLTAGFLAIEIVPDLMTQPFTISGGRWPVKEAGKYHVNLMNLPQLLSPRALGQPADFAGPDSYWESMISIGWVPLLLGTIAIVRSPGRREVLAWLALVVVASLFAFGPSFGVFRVLFAIVPGMNRFRVPARSLFLVALGASMLTGFGVEAIARSRTDWRRFFRGYATVVAILVSSLLIAPRIPSRLPHSDLSVLLGVWARLARDTTFTMALGGSSLAMLALRVRPAASHLVAIVLGCLATGELALYGRSLIRVAPASQFLGPDPVGEAIARHAPPGPFRVRVRDAFYGDGRAFALGLEKTNLNDSFQIQHAADLYERLYPMFGTLAPPLIRARYRTPVQAAVLERMNVAMLVSNRDDDRFGWPIVSSGRWDGVPFTIRKNPDPLPRAYMVPRAQVIPDGPAMVDRLSEVPARSAVLMSLDPLPIPGDRQPYTPADYVSSGPDHAEIRVTTQAPGLLVVADTWMPGWSAELDGTPVPIHRGNRAQRVVVIDSPGSHRVVMTFTPPGLRLGRTITLMSVSLWCLLALWKARSSHVADSIAIRSPPS
ncbi:MAG: hypothetical protein JWN86_2670 [Planctomycetota bacterium]|nr:hypothetical protein [Planctomycetota bacterium]